MSRLATTGCLVVLLTGCLADTSLAPDVGGLAIGACNPEDSDPEVDVSYANDIAPIIEARCVGCHTPGRVGTNESALSLTSHGELVRGGLNSGGDIVVPGDPCVSILVQKLGEAPPFGSRMPRGGTPLSRSDRRLIADWISEGANDN
jgi:hypothetical protein